MKTKLLLFFILFNGFAYAQNANLVVDSLLVALQKTKNDTIQSRIYIRLASNLQQENPKKALFYANKGLLIVQKMNWKKGLAIFNNDIGNIFLNQSKHKEALNYFLKSLEYSYEIKFLKAITLQNISLVYLKEENITLSIKYNELAFELAKEENLNATLGSCYATFGNIFLIKKEKSKAKTFFLKSYEIWKKENNKIQQATILMHLGEVSDDLKSKIQYYEQSKAIWDNENPSYLMAVSNAMGLAEEYIKLAKNNFGLKNSGLKISKNELINKAEAILIDAIKFSKQSNVQQNLMFAYGKLSELEEVKGNYKKALHYINLNYEIYIAVFSQESKNKIAALENQKAIAQKNHEIDLKNKEKIRQKWFFGFILGFLIIIAILLYRQSQIRKKSNQKLQILNADLDSANKNKARFFSILNHDLRQPVSNLIDFMHIQKESPELLDQKTRSEIISQTTTSVENILSSMEDILKWSKSQMENFSPKMELIAVDKIFTETANHFSYEKLVDLKFQNTENIILNTDENYLKTIVRNLTGNAIKSFANVENGLVHWQAYKIDNQTFISISDNGNGSEKENFKALYDDSEVMGIQSGLGLHLIRDLAKAIDCEISVDSKIGVGTTFLLQFS